MTESFPMELHEGEGYLLASFSGLFILEQAKTHAVELAREAKKRGTPRLLLDVRSIAGVMTLSDQHLLIRAAAEVFPRPFRFAVLRGPDSLAEDSFSEISAWNWGLKLKVFTSRTDAEQWLGSER